MQRGPRFRLGSVLPLLNSHGHVRIVVCEHDVPSLLDGISLSLGRRNLSMLGLHEDQRSSILHSDVLLSCLCLSRSGSLRLCLVVSSQLSFITLDDRHSGLRILSIGSLGLRRRSSLNAQSFREQRSCDQRTKICLDHNQWQLNRILCPWRWSNSLSPLFVKRSLCHCTVLDEIPGSVSFISINSS